MFAVIKTGGKQYKVVENQILKVEKLECEVGDKIKFDDVLSFSDGEKITIGEPLVKGAVVNAEVIEQKKDKKVIIFKKKRRQGYKRKLGHRQYQTVLKILDFSQSE